MICVHRDRDREFDDLPKTVRLRLPTQVPLHLINTIITRLKRAGGCGIRDDDIMALATGPTAWCTLEAMQEFVSGLVTSGACGVYGDRDGEELIWLVHWKSDAEWSRNRHWIITCRGPSLWIPSETESDESEGDLTEL